MKVKRLLIAPFWSFILVWNPDAGSISVAYSVLEMAPWYMVCGAIVAKIGIKGGGDQSDL